MDQKLASMAQLVGALFHKPKSHWFNSQSGNIPRLRVSSLVGACIQGNQSILLYLPLPSTLSQKMGMSSSEDLQSNTWSRKERQKSNK